MPASITDIQCSVVELRQYTLRQGQRDVLIDLFERQFVETQEDLGMAVMGQFRDLDDADRFVWLRGFRDMAARRIGLSEFYGGPAWRSHREMANATMIDSDNVLLLRPAWPGVGIDMKGRTRSVFGSSAERTGRVDATIFHLREPASGELLAFCRQTMSPVLTRDAAQVLGWYASESAPNNFPVLPVRENEFVLVAFAMFDSAASLEDHVRSGVWAREVQPRLEKWLARPTECHRLAPTARSAIHG